MPIAPPASRAISLQPTVLDQAQRCAPSAYRTEILACVGHSHQERLATFAHDTKPSATAMPMTIKSVVGTCRVPAHFGAIARKDEKLVRTHRGTFASTPELLLIRLCESNAKADRSCTELGRDQSGLEPADDLQHLERRSSRSSIWVISGFIVSDENRRIVSPTRYESRGATPSRERCP